MMCKKWCQDFSMHYRVKYLFVILGILGSSLAASDRVKREESDADRASRLCRQLFGVPCSLLNPTPSSVLPLPLNPTPPSVLPPPLNTALPNVVEQDCICVPYYRCCPNTTPAPSTTTVHPVSPDPIGTTVSPDNTNLGTTPDPKIFVIDERFGESCPGTLDVCCPRSSVINDTGATVPTPTPPPLNPQRTGCGYRNPNGLGISNSDRVKREESDADRASRLCRQLFGVPCLTLNPTASSVLPLPLNPTPSSVLPLPLNPTPSSVLPPPLNTSLPYVVEQDCICVPYYRCSLNTTPAPSTTTVHPVSPDPIGTTVSPDNTNLGTTPDSKTFVIDERFGESCPGTLDVCCPRSSVISDTGATVPTPTPPPLNPQRTGCGYRNPNGLLVRITGNTDKTHFAEFPWMIVVLKKSSTGSTGNYHCGGSLIHPQVVLTTAHNVVKYANRPSDLVVRAGEWDAATRLEPIAHQQREVETIILHEGFVRSTLVNDFALLILKNVFDSAPNVNTICLPEESDVFDAARCIATGWGKDSFGSAGRFQAVLKKIELPVVPHDACQSSLRLTQPGRIFNLDQSSICAGGEPGKDTCRGDGGSPLVCPLQNAQDRYVQAGIVSWGIGCGGNRVPGVYSSVAKARRWIDSKMALYNFETTS